VFVHFLKLPERIVSSCKQECFLILIFILMFLMLVLKPVYDCKTK